MTKKSKKKSVFLYHPNNPSKSFDVYINKNPSDTIPIKYTTVQDVENTIKKLEKLYKQGKYPHKRIWQVGMILKVRLEAMNKYKKTKYPNAKNVYSRFKLAEKYFKFLSKRTKVKNEIQRKKMKFNKLSGYPNNYIYTMVRKNYSKRKSKKQNYSRKKRGGAAAYNRLTDLVTGVRNYLGTRRPAHPATVPVPVAAPGEYPFNEIRYFQNHSPHASKVTAEIQRHLEAMNRIIENRKNIEFFLIDGNSFKLKYMRFSNEEILKLTNYKLIYKKLNENNYNPDFNSIDTTLRAFNVGLFRIPQPNSIPYKYERINRTTKFDDNITSILISNIETTLPILLPPVRK